MVEVNEVVFGSSLFLVSSLKVTCVLNPLPP